MGNKLLVICGPTATGKTRLALHLAKTTTSNGKVPAGEIISADSRQVYLGMDIGTGKDLPPNTKLGRVYQIDGVKIWGYDLVDPKKEFSVSQYLKIATKIIKNIWERDKIPIIVGGTGLYIKALLDGIATAEIPKNKSLRKVLETKTVDELFESLAQINSSRAASLNSSDRKNKRSLIRAIEIAQWLIDKKLKVKSSGFYHESDCLLIGLEAPKSYLARRIKSRVETRMRKGVVKEIKRLLSSGVGWNSQAMNSLGYRQWRGYFEGGVNVSEVLTKWAKDELSYVKRQMTWFKKDKRIVWFDISKGNYEKEVEKLAQKWYSTS